MATHAEKTEIKSEILRLVGETKVAYDRELRYRLERRFPHDAVANAVRELLKEQKLKQTNLPGRRGSGENPNKFYCLPGTNYKEIVPIMREKLDLSIFIAGVGREMGRHAELAWWKAFKNNGWQVYPESEEKNPWSQRI